MSGAQNCGFTSWQQCELTRAAMAAFAFRTPGISRTHRRKRMRRLSGVDRLFVATAPALRAQRANFSLRFLAPRSRHGVLLQPFGSPLFSNLSTHSLVLPMTSSASNGVSRVIAALPTEYEAVCTGRQVHGHPPRSSLALTACSSCRSANVQPALLSRNDLNTVAHKVRNELPSKSLTWARNPRTPRPRGPATACVPLRAYPAIGRRDPRHRMIVVLPVRQLAQIDPQVLQPRRVGRAGSIGTAYPCGPSEGTSR
jgi:hypothetical protein